MANLEIIEIESLKGLSEKVISELVQDTESNYCEVPYVAFVNDERCLYGPPDVIKMVNCATMAVFHFSNPISRVATRVIFIKNDPGEENESSWEMFPTGLLVPGLDHHDDQFTGLSSLAAMLTHVAEHTRTKTTSL